MKDKVVQLCKQEAAGAQCFICVQQNPMGCAAAAAFCNPAALTDGEIR